MKKIHLLLFLFISANASAQLLYDHGPLMPPKGKFEIQPNFVAVGSWGKTNITYFFQNGTTDIAGTGEQASVIQGMQLWATYTPLPLLLWQVLPLLT